MNRSYPWKLGRKILAFLGGAVFLTGCQTIELRSLPAVPTHQELPYSVAVEVTSLNIYWVEPGAATWSLPPLRHYVTTRPLSANLDKKQWQKVLTEYLHDRKTFQRVVKTGEEADLKLELRVNLFIDPGASFKFDYHYWAHVDGVMKIARYDRQIMQQTGFGKAQGTVTQSRSKNEIFVNEAVFQALDAMITKLERARQLKAGSLVS